MTPIDHERYSERLNAYVRGTLGSDEAEEVRAHLAECSECRHEEAAVIALLEDPVDGLRPDESKRLLAAVLSEIESETKPSLVAAPSKAAFVEPRRSWAPRIAQFMAAAAVIALAAIYLTNPQVGPIGGDDGPVPAANGEAEGGGGAENRAGDTEEAPGTVADQVAEEQAGGSGASTAEQEAGKDGDGSRSNAGDAPTEEDAVGAIAAPGEESGDDNLTTAMKVNEAAFGAEAAIRGQR